MGSDPVTPPELLHVTNFVHAERISLKSDSAYDESWLESRIRENPGSLGLGELTNISNQVTQRGAGRLDIQADDVKSEQRYVIELMLGELDGDHIIRIIDYWLRRSNQDAGSDREVVAVLAADKIALARYFGVVQFLAQNLAKFMPFIVLEMTALKVGNQTTVVFNKIIDNSISRVVDEDEHPREVSDRSAWVDYTSPENIGLIDNIFVLLKELDRRIEPNYLPAYIGIKIDNRSINFCYFQPRKKFVIFEVFKVKEPDVRVEQLANLGLAAEVVGDKVSIKLKPADFDTCSAVLAQMLKEAYDARMHK